MIKNLEPLVSVIILNFNSKEYLENCIDSIKNANYSNIEIIVVDNNSTDDSGKLAKQKFQDIKLIENDKNLGFSEGNNVGLHSATGDFYVIINPDTTVSSNWLNELYSAFEKYGNGFYQPKILFLDKKNIINSAGGLIHPLGFGSSSGLNEIDNQQYDHEREINFPSGACFFTSKDVIKKIGGFDSFLFITNDDKELGWRSSIFNIPTFFIPSSVIYHKGSHVLRWNKTKFFFLERNRHYLLLTLYSRITLLKILPPLILINFLIFIFYTKKGLILEQFRIYLNLIKNWRIISKKYRQIQKSRLVSDKKIIESFSYDVFLPNDISTKNFSKWFNSLLLILGRFCKKVV